MTNRILIAVLCCLPAGSLRADDHRHRPIVVPSKPVIERIPLKVAQPVDVVVSEYDEIFVVDSLAGMLFRIDADHQSSLLIEDMRGINEVAANKSEIVVLQSLKRNGRIVRVSENGLQQPVASFAFQPVGLAIDNTGRIWTANGRSGIVYQLDSEGTVLVKANLSETVVDLVVDDVGSCTALLKSGQLIKIFGDASTDPAGHLPKNIRRIQFNTKRQVIGISDDEIPELFSATESASEVNRVARTMRGTTAFDYDRLGNLVLSSPDLRAITKVTSHFEVPCPHCGDLVPMHFSTAAPANPKRRSF